jgi:hydrogenase expression/formation protein HypC
MCLAIPGKIIKISGGKAVVQYPGESRDVLVAGEPVKVGDYVLVQMGIIIKKVSQKQAKNTLSAWSANQI